MSTAAVRSAKPNFRAFPASEYDARLVRVRRSMKERSLDGLLVSSPENIYYLTGLNYQGYFAYQLLIVPLEGSPVLVTRAMERAIIRDKVPGVRHIGYSDGVDPVPPEHAADSDLVMAEPDGMGLTRGLRPWSTSLGIPTRVGDRPVSPYEAPARVTRDAIVECGLGGAYLGIEKGSSFFAFGIAEAILGGLPKAQFADASDLVTDCRLVQSPLELEYTRRAAKISEAMVMAAVAAAGPGVRQSDILSALYQTMFARGGTYPGFVPLVRSTHTLDHEHGAWEDGRLSRRDVLFVELSGCVQRYHAPMTRLIFIGKAPTKAFGIQRVCEDAIEAAQATIRAGVKAKEVYAAWQARVDAGGLSWYRRHHCGYLVGIGFPPSWSGNGVPVGLRADSDMVLQTGMVFHLMSWLLRTGRGDFIISDTVVVTEHGCELLTNVPRNVIVR